MNGKNTWDPIAARRFVVRAARVWEHLWFREGDVVPARVMWHEGWDTWVRWAPGNGARIRRVVLPRKAWLWTRVVWIDTPHRCLVLVPYSPEGDWQVADLRRESILLRAPDGAEVSILYTPETWRLRAGDRVGLDIERVSYDRGCASIQVKLRTQPPQTDSRMAS